MERRLVIAIDYGTTYTGIAFATPAGNRASLNEIDTVNSWGDEMSNDEKIPSVISYSPASKKHERQWGSSLSTDAVSMVHTKLALDLHDNSGELDLVLEALDGMRDLQFQYIKSYGGLPPYPWKRPEEIVEDYLSKVFDSFLEAMTRFPQVLRDRLPVDIVVTIPAGWPYRAINSTFRALTRAGFNQNTFPRLTDMLLVLEPVAAAIYTARYLREEEGADFLRKGECFTLCDAGGGTVDVVSYKVKQLQPTFELERVTLATGSKCGSIFVDLAFKKWLRGLLGEKDYQKLNPSQLVPKIGSHFVEGQQMRELMKGFETQKRKFNSSHRDIKMDLPDPLQNLNKDGKVVGGEITITNKIMRSFFDPRIDKIVELIQGQIAQIVRLRTRIRNIFLVGGFAESEYLQEEITRSLHMRGIQLRRPDTSWTAVVRGAAIFGIEKPVLPTMSACSRSYGVSVNESFSDIRHDIEDQFVHPIADVPMAKEQLLWLIKKGDLILSDKPKEVKQLFDKSFTETEIRAGTIPIYSYDHDDIPERFANSESDLTLVHTVKYDLSQIPLQEFRRRKSPRSKMPFYLASLELILKLNLQQLSIELSWKDRLLFSEDISCH